MFMELLMPCIVISKEQEKIKNILWQKTWYGRLVSSSGSLGAI